METACQVDFLEPPTGELTADGTALPVAGYLGEAGRPVLRLRFDLSARGPRPGRLELGPAHPRLRDDPQNRMAATLFLIHLWDAFEPAPEGSGGQSISGDEGIPVEDTDPGEGTRVWLAEAPDLVPPWPGAGEAVERLRLEFRESGRPGGCGLVIWRAGGVAALIAEERQAASGALHQFERLLS